MSFKNRNKLADLTGTQNTLYLVFFLILFLFRDTIEEVFAYNLLGYLNRFDTVNKVSE